MPNPLSERREMTRDALARTVLRLLCLIAAATVAVIVFRHSLRISSASLDILERLFLGVLGLAALVAKFYFTGPR